MPYIMTRDEDSLGLKVGDKLECEKLPSALKFSAALVEPEPEPELKKSSKK